jgi:hypothetical protein
MNLVDKAKDFASQAKEKADEVRGDLTEKAGPLAEKAAGIAAKGVTVAAARVDQATGGKYRDKIENVSGKLNEVLTREGHTGESEPDES